MELSRLKASTKRPLGLKQTLVTAGLSSCTRVRRHWPVEVSQTRLATAALSATGVSINQEEKRRREQAEEKATHINPSVEQLTTKVPSLQKSTPLTGSLCAGKLRINLPA